MKLLQVLGAGLALTAAVPQVCSQGTLTQILTNGPTSSRVNLVFLSEGYLSSQSSQFATDARRALTSILQTAPYNGYSNYFNAFTIFVPSAEAGSDHPSSGIHKNTYFNSSFESYGIAQLLTIPPNSFDGSYANGRGKVDALLQSLVPEYDLCHLVVNDTMYGGSGGPVLITSVHNSSPEIAVHEMGHTYAGLGDEYDTAYPGYPDTEEPNTTTQASRSLLKWRDWVQASTPVPTPETAAYATLVGLFEGAHYHATGWYRPKLDCRMNHLGVAFCEVCAEALVKTTYGLVRPIQTLSPSTNNVLTVYAPQSLTLRVTPLQPSGRNLSVQWFTNSVAVPGATSLEFTIAAAALPVGPSLVKAEVADTTALVRTDPLQLLKDSRTWRVNAQPRPTLQAQVSQNQIILSWPAAATDFLLEYRTNLTTGRAWTLSETSAVVVNDRFTVTNLLHSGACYYRLRW